MLLTAAAATRPFPCERAVRVLSQAERAIMNWCMNCRCTLLYMLFTIYICVFQYMYVHIYIYVCMCMYVYVCVCMYMYVCSKWKGVPYHLWAKMWHPEDPTPTSFGSPKNTWGGYISCGQVKYFSEFSCLTPPNIPGLKGGILLSSIKLSLLLCWISQKMKQQLV